MRFAKVLLVFVIPMSAQIALPTDFEGWKHRGDELASAKSYSDVLVAYTHAIDLKPSDGPTLSALTIVTNELAAPLGNSDKFRKLEEARAWNRRWLIADPNSSAAHFWAGFLIWEEFYPALMTVRAGAHMLPSEPGPLPPSRAKADLIAKSGAMVDEGVEHLRRAVALDYRHQEAMSYLNLLIRERADLRQTAEQYQKETQEADDWVSRAIQTGELKERTATSLPEFAAAHRIRVDGKVQVASLIHKVDPACPALAVQLKIGDVVKFTVIIARDGTLQNIQVVSGHPLLVPSALDAVKQWQYKPTLVNDVPVEVTTTIDLDMRCQN